MFALLRNLLPLEYRLLSVSLLVLLIADFNFAVKEKLLFNWLTRIYQTMFCGWVFSDVLLRLLGYELLIIHITFLRRMFSFASESSLSFCQHS